MSRLGWSVSGVPTAAIVIAAVLLIVWQWRPLGDRQRRLAWSIVVASLALLALRPVTRTTGGDGAVMLLTEGADPAGLARARGEPSARYALPDAGPVAGTGARTIPDVSWLVRQVRPARLTVVGRGLEPWDRALVDGMAVDFIAVEAAPGIVAVDWSRRARLGETWTVRGRTQGLGAGTLTLLDPAGPVDEAQLDADGSFVLAAVPRSVGPVRYRLRFSAAEGGDQAMRLEEKVDVSVTPPRLPRVLWLEAAPGFETRYLGAWLTSEGSALGVRTVISRDRFRFTRHNFSRQELPDLDLARLTDGLLERFDVVVAEARFLATLSRRAEGVLRAAVKSGLGLLVLPSTAVDEELPAWITWRLEMRNAEGQGEFSADADDDEETMSVRVRWQGDSTSTPLEVPQRRLALGDRAVPLAVDPFGRVLAAQRPQGDGRVGISLLTDSYRWVLEGNAEHHRQWWSRLLGAVARPHEGPRIALPAGPILGDRQLTITVELDTGSAVPADARLTGPDGDVRDLAWLQDLLEPSRFEATLWPDRRGWHRLEVGGETVHFDVVSAAGWRSWQAARRIAATRNLAAAMHDAETLPVRLSTRPVALLPLFVLAWIAAAGLWLRERQAPPAARSE